LIDLRSDTVTKPSAAMRAAMAAAEVGDDVYAEDPTVNELEAQCAAVLGKEKALFVTSGTMGNLVSVLAHTQRGDEIIAGDEAHIFYYELAGVSALGGVQVRTVPNRGGAVAAADIELAIRPASLHFPRTSLVCLENTHNRGGGRPLSISESAAIVEAARRHGIAVHLDGSRIFNAAVALGVSVDALACGVGFGQYLFLERPRRAGRFGNRRLSAVHREMP
jgi:threonine aldolase